ncbi:MAG: hypothetical protein IT252_06325 [Chitinophagaceae bacterium]|nr:hypothetical protein [Chitinophagaceae bacterium]
MQQQINMHLIGGCMLGQKALGLSNLFYRKYSAKLSEAYGVRSNIQLDGHNDFDMLPAKAAAIEPSSLVPQILIIQLRPALIFRRCNLLTPVREKGKFPFQINPYATGKNRQSITTNAITIDDTEIGEAHVSGILNKLLATVNALAGLAVGFHKKGSSQIVDALVATANICAQKNIQLIIIGCINSYQNKLIKIQYEAVNTLLKKTVREKGISYVDVFPEMEKAMASGNAVFLEDRYHLSAAGHAVVADALFQETASGIYAWLQGFNHQR